MKFMKTENMNKAFMDKVLKGEAVDHLYHYGVSSNDKEFDLLKEIRAVVMAGSAHRIHHMAEAWTKKYGKEKVYHFPKDERFKLVYSNGVLFSSHGMGMPSASIAVQELMKLVYYSKKGDPKEMNKIFWCRVGTSGGVGVAPGSVVITTEAVLADLKPYRLFVAGKERFFEPKFPEKCIEDIIKANAHEKINIVKGKTIGADSFYIEQNRIDGAIAMCTEKEKMEWLKRAEDFGVKNIEMETPLVAGFLNHWGFTNFAAICCTLLNRLHGDQVTSTKEQLDAYSLNAERVLNNYLEAIIKA